MIKQRDIDVIALAFGGVAYLVTLAADCVKNGPYNANTTAEVSARRAEEFARAELGKVSGS